MADAQYVPPMGVGQPGAVNQGGGGGAQQLAFRDALDARRSGMAGFIPSAQYPDGYLGTIQSRREDRLLQKLQKQLGDRSYQRGVHKGERVDPGDYLWPPELQPDRGLRAQAMAVPVGNQLLVPRAAPLGTVQEQMVASGGRELPMTPRGRIRPLPGPYDTPADRAAALRGLTPTWR